MLVFHSDSPIVKKYYTQDRNYKIIPGHKENKYVVIYFSSNDIYYPNNRRTFEKRIIEEDRYEWSKNLFPNTRKHIFVRDIHKQWYLYGINKDINSIKKLENFLRKESNGYPIITIGSSAGGYAAILFGKLLSAERIYCFNGQVDLYNLIEDNDISKNPIVIKHKNNKNFNQYYNLEKIIDSNSSPVLYFYSNRSPIDQYHFNILKKHPSVSVISINTRLHGLPIWPNSLKNTYLLQEKQLKEISRRNWSPFKYSIKIAGYKSTFAYLFGNGIRKIKKLIKKTTERSNFFMLY